MVMWLKRRGEPLFHTGAARDGSFVALCDHRWPIADAAYGVIERHVNPADEDRCSRCVQVAATLEAERSEVHMFVDYFLSTLEADDPDGIASKLAREIKRLRLELETRTTEVHVLGRALADAQEVIDAVVLSETESGCSKYGAALVEAIDIAQSAGRRGLLSTLEARRLRELARTVPQ
jgi:hypothetical protein